MSDASNEPRRPHAQPMAAPYLEVDIARELQKLQSEAGWQSGHSAKTLVKYDGLRVVLIALKAAFDHSGAPRGGTNLNTIARGAHPGSGAGAKLRAPTRRAARIGSRGTSRRRRNGGECIPPDNCAGHREGPVSPVKRPLRLA